MTQLPFDEDAIFLPQQSPNETLSSRSDVRSPGKQHLQATAAGSRGSCSLSPAAETLIYTPASTLLDFQDDAAIEDLESDEVTTSPDSSNHTDDFVHVASQASGYRGRMNIRPPLHQLGVSPSTQPSLPSRESSVPHTVQATRPQQWHSFTSSSSAAMDDSFIPYSSSAELFSAGTFADDELFSVGDLDGSCDSQTYENIPFRTFDDGSVQLPASFDQTTLLSQQHTDLRQHQHVATSFPEQSFTQPFNIFSPLTSQQQYSGGFSTRDFAYQGNQVNSTATHPPHPNRVLPSNANAPRQPTRIPLSGTLQTTPNASAATRSRRQPYPQPQHAQFAPLPQVDEKPVPSSKRSPTNASGHNYSTSTFSARPSNLYPSIVKREPASQSSTAATGPVRSSQAERAERARRGGRSRNSHLSDHTRQKSHAMRKVGACWRCAMQRDPVSEDSYLVKSLANVAAVRRWQPVFAMLNADAKRPNILL